MQSINSKSFVVRESNVWVKFNKGNLIHLQDNGKKFSNQASGLPVLG